MTGYEVLWLIGLGTVCVSAGLTGVFRQYALRVNLLDHPNTRSSHHTPTPRGGGIAVVVTFCCCTIFLWMQDYILLETLVLILGCGGLVAFVGLVDDYYSLQAKVRFTVHLVTAVSVLVLLPRLPDLQLFHFHIKLGGLAGILIVLGLVWLLNLYNFMDGIDGIASMETITIAIGAATIIWFRGGNQGHIVLLLLLAAATLGFLVWNWPPAKIFMGDACSGFLGFCIGALALVTSTAGGINLWSWLILLALFVVDATVTLLRRVWRGDKFYEAHRSHAYQILARRWQSHKKVTLFVVCLNIVWCFPLAVLAAYYPGWGVVLTVIAFLFPAIGVIMAGAGTTNH